MNEALYEINTRQLQERIEDEYIKWLHAEHNWVPGAAEIAIDAFHSGFRAGLVIGADIIFSYAKCGSQKSSH